MLSAKEKQYVIGQLCSLVASQSHVRATLVAGMPPRLQLQLADGTLPKALVVSAVNLCINDGYNENPSALYSFLDVCLPGDPSLVAVLQRIRKPLPAGPAAPDVFDTEILFTKFPFLARRAVRGYLRSLVQDVPAQPIVVVRGPTHGKTHTTELIDHACRDRGDIQSCHIEVSEGQGSNWGPGELASDIVTQLGGDPEKMPQQKTNAERWHQELANWVVVTAGRAEKWWIILDGFNDQELRPETANFIAKLAHVLTTGAARKLHRLILMDFDHTNLTVPPGTIAVDTTAPIARTVVEKFVTDLVTPAGVDPARVIDVITTDMADPVTDLPELARRLNGLIIEMAG